MTPGIETARITITRILADDDVFDTVTAVDPDGDDLPLTEALGMMRLARGRADPRPHGRNAVTTPQKIQIATDAGLMNAEHIATACIETGVPFAWGCALIEQESGGRSVYGHDVGGALSGFPYEVNIHNYRVFKWLIDNGHRSNGVGPAQITFAPYFDEMEGAGLDPSNPAHNILKGMRELRDWRAVKRVTWHVAAGHYNGGSVPNMTYADEVRAKARAWRRRFRGVGA